MVQGRAVAALIADRGSEFYLLSVYLHPDRVRQDLRALISAWENFDRVNARVLVTGDFNRADERCPDDWNKWLDLLQVFDVCPTLGTYRHPGGISPLDRCLVPEEWVSSARWNPCVTAIEPRGAQGHMILKLQVRLKPCVLNCPTDPKHETIPSNVFMPGKDGNIPKEVSSLYGLVRLLHRQHFLIFQDVPRRNGFEISPGEPCNEEDTLHTDLPSRISC